MFIQGWVFYLGGQKIGLGPSTLSGMAEVSEEPNIPTAVNIAYGTLENRSPVKLICYLYFQQFALLSF